VAAAFVVAAAAAARVICLHHSPSIGLSWTAALHHLVSLAVCTVTEMLAGYLFARFILSTNN